MNIEQVNVVLNRAILGLQDGEVESMVEAMARGVTSYDVPAPTKKGMPRKRRKKKAPVEPAKKLPSDDEIERHGKWHAVLLHRHFMPKFVFNRSSRDVEMKAKEEAGRTMLWVYQTLKKSRPLSIKGLHKKYLQSGIWKKFHSDKMSLDILDLILDEFADLDLLPGDYYQQPKLKLIR